MNYCYWCKSILIRIIDVMFAADDHFTIAMNSVLDSISIYLIWSRRDDEWWWLIARTECSVMNDDSYWYSWSWWDVIIIFGCEVSVNYEVVRWISNRFVSLFSSSKVASSIMIHQWESQSVWYSRDREHMNSWDYW